MTKPSDHAPAAAKAASSPDRRATPPKKPLAMAASVTTRPSADRFDATRTASLLLRHPTRAAAAALEDQGAGRRMRLVQVAHEQQVALMEVAAIAALAELDWEILVEELATMMVATRRVQRELRGLSLASVAEELARALEHLGPRVDISAWDAAKAADQAYPLAAVGAPDRVVLAQQTLLAARQQLARFQATQPGADRDAAAELCAPVPLHLGMALEAMLGVTARELRRSLTPAVEQLSSEMDALAQALAMTPRLTWHAVFAQAFDSENQLRKAMGLAPKARPYTGTIDPAAASKLVRDDPSKLPQAYGARDHEDPQGAVEGIAVQLNAVFAGQISAVEDLKDNLAEPQVSKRSALELALEIAVDLAISAAAGGLGSLVASRLTRMLASSTSERAAAEIARQGLQLSPGEREAVLGKRQTDTALRRAVAVDTTRKAVRELFKTSAKRGLAAAKSSSAPYAGTARNAFIQQQARALRRTQLEAALMMTHLAPALGQLDLSALNDLVHGLANVPAAAETLQYETSMREWLNLRARLDAAPRDPQRSLDPDLGAPSYRPHGEQPIDGVLEIGLGVGADPAIRTVTLDYLVLRNAEPAAIRYFKNHPRALAETGLNRHYQLNFTGVWNRLSSNWLNSGDALSSAWVKLGVGARDGFQPSSLRPSELRLLKIYAAGDRVRLGTAVDALLLRTYDTMPDAAAFAVALDLIGRARGFTTASLED